MKIKIFTTSAASTRAGNPQLNQLAEKWLVMQTELTNTNAKEDFYASLLDYIKSWNPASNQLGFQKSELDDINQETAILLTNGFLEGNETLLEGTASSCLIQIENGLLHAIRSARRLVIKREVEKKIRLQDLHARLVLHTPAAVRLTTNIELSGDERKSLVMNAVDFAIQQRRIDPEDAIIILTQIEKSMSQADLAKETGVSRQAIHQREARGVKVVRRVVRELEGGVQ